MSVKLDFLALMKGHRLRMFQNRVRGRILGLNRNEQRNYTKKSFIICILYHTSLGRSKRKVDEMSGALNIHGIN
jgi:hypothetical protein